MPRRPRSSPRAGHAPHAMPARRRPRRTSSKEPPNRPSRSAALLKPSVIWGQPDSTLSAAISIKHPCRCVSVPAPVWGLSSHVCPLPPRVRLPVLAGSMKGAKHDCVTRLDRDRAAGVNHAWNSRHRCRARSPAVPMACRCSLDVRREGLLRTLRNCQSCCVNNPMYAAERHTA